MFNTMEILNGIPFSVFSIAQNPGTISVWKDKTASSGEAGVKTYNNGLITDISMLIKERQLPCRINMCDNQIQFDLIFVSY